MALLIGWYLLFLGVLVGIAVACYRPLRARLGAWVALLPVAAVLVLGALLVPMPMHGGFTTPVSILWEEAASALRDKKAPRERYVDPTLEAYLHTRFAGALEFSPEVGGRGRLRVATGTAFGRGWYEPESGLVWTDPLRWPEAAQLPTLEAARDFCARQAPIGYWALPTDAELYFFWRAGGPVVSPNPGFDTVAQLVDLDTGMAIPTYHRGARTGYVVRCVGRAPGAPEGGYTRRDVALSDWNEYQLAGGRGY